MTLWYSLLSGQYNYISRALSPQPIQHFSVKRLDPYLDILWLTFISSIWLVILCSYNSFQICYHKPVVCWAWVRVEFPKPHPGSLFIGQHTHVVAPQRHRNPLRIHQWQDGAFLINSVWSHRCFQPHWETHTHTHTRAGNECILKVHVKLVKV